MISIKIVIAGALSSGKSSFIKFLDGNALNVEAKGQDNQFYTVGMDLGSLKLNGFDIFLFGTPGLMRFSVMRDVIADGADGLIFLFDSSNPETDEDAISILNSIRKLIKPNTPIIFVLNKNDISGARSPEVVKAQNNLPDDCKIFSTNTKTGENINEAMTYLVNEIYNKYKEVLELMRNYETNIRGLGEKLKLEKIQMRDFLNNLEIKRFIEIDRKNKNFKVKIGMKNLI